MTKQLYFAYGSNMDPYQMLERCSTAKPLGTATLENHKVVQRKYADIEYSQTDKVEGVLYTIVEEDLQELDIYEGYPEYYDRKLVKVSHLFGDCEAIVYVMTAKYREANNDLPYSRKYRMLCNNAAEFWRLEQNPYKFEIIDVKDLMQALYHDDFAKVQEFLFKGADVNRPYNRNDWTPFMWVCKEHGRSEILDLFIAAGGNVHSRNKDGETPFLISARKRSSYVPLEILLKAGSDIFATNKHGDKAIDLVRNHPQAEMRHSVIEFLKQKELELKNYITFEHW